MIGMANFDNTKCHTCRKMAAYTILSDNSCLIGLHDPPIFAVYAYIHMHALCILMGSICIPSDMYNTTLAGTTPLAALLQAYLQQ